MAIQKTSLVDIAIDRIKSYIYEHNLKPNDKFFSEKELINKLQVSRTVIREALISLQAVGILQVKSGGGVYVAEPKLDPIHTILKHRYSTYGVKIKELMQTREIIELGALRLIIENQIDVDIDHLKALNDSYYETIMKNEDTKKYDRLFHESLIKATQNTTYCTFAEMVNEYFSLVKINEKEDGLLLAYKQHDEMIEAIRERSLQRAQQVMKKHFEPIFYLIHQMEDNK
ncbi:FadR/GntR family transcriptional regulator [Neobacillus kokaensis]|uniref:GntR family transcriptional regulator n=1 Tax=Neobacillus kokaensis TaxID=2759023 RepID=A0ABQ3NB47_9BACI|nr:FCD domain-containing protein [Neobacillus kokaensis]GHI01124.1 GntR family transcriptional regulator [Neobacillus kokaensis]